MNKPAEEIKKNLLKLMNIHRLALVIVDVSPRVFGELNIRIKIFFKEIGADGTV